MANIYGAQGVSPSLRGQPSNDYELQAGTAYLIPSGTWSVHLGRYLKMQEYDPITTIWRDIGDEGSGRRYVQSDGVNHRIANQTGCAVAALILNAGSGFTSAPTVTASAGASVWLPIIGGALSTTITVTNGGSGYVYPPIVLIAAPPSPGIQATAYCTLSSGAVSSVTVTDQGAGYPAPPTVSFVNDPRDTAGSGATGTTALTGANTITGLLATDFGNPVSGTTLPSLAFTGGGGAGATALVLMDWSITSITVAAAGGLYTPAAGTVEIRAIGGEPTSATAYTNPQTQLGLVRDRWSSILLATGTGGTLFSAASNIQYRDGGLYMGVPNLGIVGSAGGTGATITFTMGGQNDSFRLFAS